MYLKSLTIFDKDGNKIRDIRFHTGLNLIVDETPVVTGKETGNNVGKTTVLKLVNFCLGGDPKGIYSDQENQKNEYKLVKEFLINNQVLVSLVLKDNLLVEDSREIKIERNFLSRKLKIQRINDIDKNDEEFEEALTSLLFPDHYGKKPTFKQIIAHNIRYKDLSLNQTIKNLNAYTRDDEYETLYLFLLGCVFENGDIKQRLRAQIKIEENFKNRLESEQTKSTYEATLAIIESEIETLEKRKASFNINSKFEEELDKLNEIKYQINLTSSEVSRLELRKSLILETQQEMQSEISSIDMLQLRHIYNQATSLISGIQKTFQELNEFHNKMVESKIRFISQDLPMLNNEIIKKRELLNRLLINEKDLSASITQGDSFKVLEQLISELNEKYYKKGEYENILNQLNIVEKKLTELNFEINEIENNFYSDEFTTIIKEQVNKFNRYFSSVSNDLYGEKYALKSEVKNDKKMTGRRIYEFLTFNTNFSSGKKQGEISCFDIAYTLFADEENIPCMHFLLTDKKELMHDNQLLKIANLVNANGIQFVTSILKDKLPLELNKNEYIIIKLSQDEKLFKVETHSTPHI